MSNLAVYRRIAAAAAGISILGVATATCADAAAATPDSPPTTVPKISDLPVPVIFQPLDAGQGLLGVPRGSIPGVATPEVADALPGLTLTALPTSDTPEPDTTTAPVPDPTPAG